MKSFFWDTVDSVLESFKKFPLFKLLYRLSWAPRFYHLCLALLGAVIYRFPGRKVKVIGVTGTKGKTTTVELISAILEAAGKKTALLSSVRVKIGGKSEQNKFGNTMPGHFFVQNFLRQAVSDNCEYAIIEVTSQGVVLSRHRFIDWDAAVFLNLAPEHIESHGSFENYRNAKVQFFRYLKHSHKPVKYFFVNEEDTNRNYFEEAARSVPHSELKIFSRYQFYKEMGECLANSWFRADFNMENAAAAAAIARAMDIADDVIVKTLEGFRGVPGRLEYVQEKPFAIVVDYAHTPDSLKYVYEAVRPSQHRLICVLGAAGGGRDKWKRPAMGAIAGAYCDTVILTDEDPYDENPEEILNEIEGGIRNAVPTRTKEIVRILDRREAIKQAIVFAKKGDTVVMTGKGSEAWIHVGGGKKIPWNERSVVEETLRTR